MRNDAEEDVKEEPMDIKEEEVDDYPYVTEEVKQEPIEDVSYSFFCVLEYFSFEFYLPFDISKLISNFFNIRITAFLGVLSRHWQCASYRCPVPTGGRHL